MKSLAETSEYQISEEELAKIRMILPDMHAQMRKAQQLSVDYLRRLATLWIPIRQSHKAASDRDLKNHQQKM